MSAALALKLIDLAIVGATLAPDIIANLKGHRGVLQRAIADGRDPTPEEWAALEGSIDALRAELHG